MPYVAGREIIGYQAGDDPNLDAIIASFTPLQRTRFDRYINGGAIPAFAAQLASARLDEIINKFLGVETSREYELILADGSRHKMADGAVLTSGGAQPGHPGYALFRMGVAPEFKRRETEQVSGSAREEQKAMPDKYGIPTPAEILQQTKDKIVAEAKKRAKAAIDGAMGKDPGKPAAGKKTVTAGEGDWVTLKGVRITTRDVNGNEIGYTEPAQLPVTRIEALLTAYDARLSEAYRACDELRKAAGADEMGPPAPPETPPVSKPAGGFGTVAIAGLLAAGAWYFMR
jgi:hypothetical protein